MTVVCAWCQRQISRQVSRLTTGRQPAHAAVSHGMCPTCLQERLAEARRPRAA